MCSTDVYCSKQTGSSSTKGSIHIISSFLELGRKESCLNAVKFVAAQKMLLKQKLANIRKWIARFYYFRHLYSAGSACVLLTIIAWVGPIWAALSLHCSLIYFWVPSSCFCIVIGLSLGNNPVQRCVCQSEAALSTPEVMVASHTDWQTALMMQPTTTSGNIITRASFSACIYSPSCICIERSNITLTHLHVGNCRVRQLPVLWHFVALGFVGNGVITVMINSPWQADDDADNQSGDNRGDSAHTSISLTVPPASLNFAIRLSAICSGWP